MNIVDAMIQDVKNSISEIQSLQSKHSSELKLREYLQITCNNLKKGLINKHKTIAIRRFSISICIVAKFSFAKFQKMKSWQNCIQNH